ncbi:LacI family DNA-binding transcriptional regulator [Pseudooceanicola algae]|uniref:HTH-type transcriptional repressor PurR n=1 Tax=Pseudooceanicola algae TaxID=1537215 RepID=A0A418SHH5_9RHOB|nr:LacI family DNA-binding transcriptional regulator [Pseudooceanicola algae]QPM90502.1 HTH-type transcriptional repressor PurR [Pseudooceanicola algae]
MNSNTPKKRITIRDVAQAAGTSVSTVSFVLNSSWKRHRVHPDTAARVQKVADDLNYRPDQRARALRLKRSSFAGMIVPYFRDGFFADMAESFETQARRRSLVPIMSSTQRNPKIEQQVAETLIAQQVELLVLAGVAEPSAIDDLCQKRGVRCVRIDVPDKDSRSSAIGFEARLPVDAVILRQKVDAAMGECFAWFDATADKALAAAEAAPELILNRTTARRGKASASQKGNPREEYMADAGRVVFDIGKTNMKLSVVSSGGETMESLSRPNTVLECGAPGPATGPWRRHDLAAAEAWLLASLADLAGRHRLGTFICTGHGATGCLVSRADLDETEPALPMIDYEQDMPAEDDEAFLAEAGPFGDRGSAIMHGATHAARQIMWVKRAAPDRFARAEMWLGLPQYWAWRLSGHGAAEITYLAAQSELWNVAEQRPSEIAQRHGWDGLLPKIRRAGDILGPIRPELAQRHGLPGNLQILTGLHDSSSNFHAYRASGLHPLTVLSTGTWLVALSDGMSIDRLDPTYGMTLNADIDGRPLGGALVMGGREFDAVAQGADGPADPDRIAGLIARQTMALPSFDDDHGQFPGSGGRGRIVGPPPGDAADRRALAVLYAALLARECLLSVEARGEVVLDGAFTRDPVFCGLVAALCPDLSCRVNHTADGVAVGAAQIAARTTTRPPMPERVASLSLPGLAAYADAWRALEKTTNETSLS